MSSDFERLIALLHVLQEQMGADAWLVLGAMLLGGIVLALLALRWIRRGGLGQGATRRFFASQTAVKHWAKLR